MKVKSYHILFRLLSYLADKTNGAPFLVKYKLLLGTLLIGLTGVSCSKPIQTGKQKETMPENSELVKAEKRNARNSIKKVEEIPSPPSIRVITPDHPEEYFITCYDPVVAYIEDTIPPNLHKNEPKEPQD